jgi:hypothetical protein
MCALESTPLVDQIRLPMSNTLLDYQWGALFLKVIKGHFCDPSPRA